MMDLRQHYEDQIVRLMASSRTDALTGLGNFRAFREHCAALDGTPFAVVLLDMTNLKRANSILGHFGADTLLQRVGASIRGGGWDAVFRHGGDEFAVVLPRIKAAAALIVRDRIEHAVGTFTLSDGTQVRAIGAVAHVAPGTNWLDEMNRADQALERRKADWKANA
jgi:diguanylate cyclase (GGDEF)-like protein